MPDAPVVVQEAAAEELLAGWADRGGRAAATARQRINDARGDWAAMCEGFARDLVETRAIRGWAQEPKR